MSIQRHQEPEMCVVATRAKRISICRSVPEGILTLEINGAHFHFQGEGETAFWSMLRDFAVTDGKPKEPERG